MTYTQNQLEIIGREAFWGNHPRIEAFIANKLGYYDNGHFYPANSYSLADAIRVMQNVTADEMKSLQPLSQYSKENNQHDLR